MEPQKRVVLIGVGGPTCSGKTTLSKYLKRIIPGSVILHQDDFAPPQEKIPFHPVHGVQDWDDAQGAIEWDRQRATLTHLKQSGGLPSEHSSHDHLNEQIPVPVTEEFVTKWSENFKALQAQTEDELAFVIFDGFLIFVDPPSAAELDVKLFVRESYDVLKKRRDDRSGYHTAEGALWKDPPGYWDQIVWPAYISAHERLFLSGDVEKGAIDPTVLPHTIILEGSQLSMEQMVLKACTEVFAHVEKVQGSK